MGIKNLYNNVNHRLQEVSMFTESKTQRSSAIPFAVKHAWLWIFLAIVLCLPSTTRANEKFTPAELDTLVSTIALYPDPLLVQVLAASVHGEEIPGAADWANQNKHLKGQELADRIELEDLPYDESVIALIPFPTVLATMAKYQVWTDQLGDAVAAQKEEVMDAVQRMRNTAYKYGHLQSNEHVKVIKEKTIIIEPVQKEYVYVPVYNPHVVFYAYSNGYPGLRYRAGVWLGAYYNLWGWGTSYFEWDTHLIYVHDYRWYHNRPRHHHPPRHHNPPPPHRYHSAPPPRHDHHAVPPPPRHDHRMAPPQARHDHHVAPPQPRHDHHAAPPQPRHDHHAAPPQPKHDYYITPSQPRQQGTITPSSSKPTKVPMSHDNAPRSRSEIERSAVHSSNTVTIRSASNSRQDDYNNQGNNQGYGNIRETHSSQRYHDDSRNSGNRNYGDNSRNGNSRGGFGKSMRR